MYQFSCSFVLISILLDECNTICLSILFWWTSLSFSMFGTIANNTALIWGKSFCRHTLIQVYRTGSVSLQCEGSREEAGSADSLGIWHYPGNTVNLHSSSVLSLAQGSQRGCSLHQGRPWCICHQGSICHQLWWPWPHLPSCGVPS